MLLAIFVYSCAIALGNFLIIKPQLRKYEELKMQKENLDNIYLKIRSTDIEQALKSLQIELEKCRSLKSSFEERIADDKEFSSVLGELNWIVEQSGVKLKSIDPQRKEGRILGKYQKMPIKIGFNGSYSQFLIFLSNLEQSRYWLLIDYYNILYNPKKPSDYNFNIVVFSIVS